MALSLPQHSINGETVWIHALSVGEVLSALPLVDAITLKYPQKNIVFTVTTLKGMTIARKELNDRVKALLVMPLDFWWSVQRLVNYVRPSVFILVETDIWPGLIVRLNMNGTKSILVNGRVSPRTFRSYRKFSYFVRAMFNGLELCLMQSDLDRERLIKIGIDPDKVRTIGNIKFDRDWKPMTSEEHLKWLERLCLGPENQVWVAGSLHRGEVEAVLMVFKKLSPFFPLLRFILAPRKLDQSSYILRQARNMGFKAVLKTELQKKKRYYDILVLDTIGELGRIYGLSKVNFVGGSLVPRGGHNLLEPAVFGSPVLFGPYTDDFALMSELMIEVGGGWRINDEEELYGAIKTLLECPEINNRMGRCAKEFVEKNRGALGRVLSVVADYV